MTTFADNYEKRCQIASKEQGIDELITELEKHQIKAESAQTGGFTMCAYIPLTDGKYIYANPEGACVYNQDDYEKDILLLDEQNIQKVTQAISDYLKGSN